jgi:hypothetical protein
MLGVVYRAYRHSHVHIYGGRWRWCNNVIGQGLAACSRHLLLSCRLRNGRLLKMRGRRPGYIKQYYERAWDNRRERPVSNTADPWLKNWANYSAAMILIKYRQIHIPCTLLLLDCVYVYTSESKRVRSSWFFAVLNQSWSPVSISAESPKQKNVAPSLLSTNSWN